MNIYEEMEKKHFAESGECEKRYLMKEPTGNTAKMLLQYLADFNLSAIQIKGCLDYARYLVDFVAHLPKEK